MKDKIASWFVALSLREKILVSIAAVLAFAVISVYLIALPLFAAISDARSDYRTALERRVSIEAKVEQALDKGKKKAVSKQSASGNIRDVIDSTAGEAGFTLDRVEPRNNGDVDVAIAQTQSSALMQWLAVLDRRGVAVSNVDIRPGANGTVAFTASFRRRQ